jgi:hypothetical protein
VSHLTATSPPDAREHLRKAVYVARPFVERFARFGFLAKGVVYIIIGYLAALAPIGIRKHPTGTHGALITLLRQPIGSVLLATLALGFGAFGLWLIIRGINDPENEGSSWHALFIRAGWVFGGMTHFGLLAAAVRMMIGYQPMIGFFRVRDDESEAHDWTATALSYPLGRWVLVAIGVGIISYGLLQIHHGFVGRLDPWLSLDRLGEGARRWIRAISRFGVTARGVVFGLIGGFLIRAAYDTNAGEARGIGGTLRELAAGPYGRQLLGITALGLVAFGIYLLVLAKHRRIIALSA